MIDPAICKAIDDHEMTHDDNCDRCGATPKMRAMHAWFATTEQARDDRTVRIAWLKRELDAAEDALLGDESKRDDAEKAFERATCEAWGHDLECDPAMCMRCDWTRDTMIPEAS